MFSFLKQLDEMDCGPTCVQIISKHYGRQYSLSYLRRLCYATHEGVSILSLSSASERIGFHSIGVK